MKKALFIILVISFFLASNAFAAPTRTIADNSGNLVGVSSGRLNTGGTSVPGSSVVAGQTRIQFAGTAVELSSDTEIIQVYLIAHATNDSTVFAGTSAVSSLNGINISSSSYLVLAIDNLTDIFVDSITDNDLVDWIAIVQ